MLSMVALAATTIMIMKIMMKRDIRGTFILTPSLITSTTFPPLLSISQTACKQLATFQWIGTALQIGVLTILTGSITPSAMTVLGKQNCGALLVVGQN